MRIPWLCCVAVAALTAVGCDSAGEIVEDDDDIMDSDDSDLDGYNDIVDCDDNDPLTYPGAPELCDGLDNDCDYMVPATEIDDDGDGVTECDGDCDDTDPTTFLWAVEACDQRDNDCDGLVPADEVDADGDGVLACGGDCDDGDVSISPNVSESCNGRDDDCDGGVDEGFDADGDGVTVCGPDGVMGNEDDDCDDTQSWLNFDDLDGDGVASCDGDCDDLSAAVHPGVTEACTGIDDNCDGDLLTTEVDEDGDGYLACEECDDADPGMSLDDGDGDGFSTCDGDCDDGDATLNLADADGDGETTCEGDCHDFDAALNLLDADGDGWGTCAGDCDDGDAALHPGDADNDGLSPCDGDCDDSNAATYPNAAEICDGEDNNCNGLAGADEIDDDGDGALVCEGDCDDSDAAVYPGAPLSCDGVEDNDCDGLIDSDVTDDDGDGHSECDGDCDDTDAGLNLVDADGDGDSSCAGDCDDANAALHLGDTDGDGWSPCAGDCDDSDATANPDQNELPGDGADNDCDGVVDEPVQAAPTGTLDLGLAHALILGEAELDRAGGAVDGSVDVNGDGHDDLLIGAAFNDGGAIDGGAAYVMHGPVEGVRYLAAAAAEIVGAQDGERAGESAVWAGDVDGDGHEDVLLGAPFHNDTYDEVGAAYLMLGPFNGTLSVSDAEATFVGAEESDNAGNAVSAGDVDGDGTPDLLIGAYDHNGSGNNNGKSYLYYGPPSGDYDLHNATHEFWGTNQNGYSGWSLTLDGDIDADGFRDLVIGASGSDLTHLVYGGSGVDAPSGDVYLATDADAEFQGGNYTYTAGYSVSTGDVDGDGADDVLIGSYDYSFGYADRGAAFLVYGGTGVDAPTGDLEFTADADAVFRGEAEEDWAGYAVACNGDVNADGYDDVLVGAPFHDLAAPFAGAAYLFYGPVTGTFDLGSADAKFVGEYEIDGAGGRVAMVGDVDGDGYGDLAVSSTMYSALGDRRGVVYLIQGGAGP